VLFASAVLLSTGAGAQSVGLAAPDAAKQDANANPDTSGDFIETPIAASAAPSSAAPAATAQTAAQPAAATPAAPAATPAPTLGAGAPFGFLSTAPRSSNLLGDMWGLRPALAQYGATLNIIENSEVLGNVIGGFQRGFEYNGLTTATLQVDTQRAFGLNGGLFNASALQIHGGNLSASNLGTLQTASGIEADRATRLWELWYQQKFGDTFDVKIGQQSIDQEFMVSQNSGYFINTMFGWPMLPSADMPGGGPAYPLSALGVRGRAHLTDNVTVLAGVYNGSPVPNNNGDPQRQDPFGTSFPLNGGVLAIAELQFVYPGPGALVDPDKPDPLSLTYKIGAWYDSESFADLRYDNTGTPLASPASDGIPASHRGDYAFYAVADQMLWRSSSEPDRTINAFLRPMFSPLQDRNLIAFSVSAGLTMHEPFLRRDDDTAGIGVNFAQVSSAATGFDQDTGLYNPGVFNAVRHNETVFEATYQYQVMPSWQVQPDVQYVLNPGGGIVNPYDPSENVKNELVFGLRTNVTF
jgi:porin